jgi:hypothetical protein
MENRMKTCRKCGESKPLSQYSLNKNSKDGKQSACKPCAAAAAKASYQKRKSRKIVEVEFKNCSVCNDVKNASEFYKRRASPDGLASYCKACDNARSKSYYKLNSDKVKAKAKKYHQENEKAISERRKQHYQDNREEIRAKQNRWNEENREYVRKRERARKSRQVTCTYKITCPQTDEYYIGATKFHEHRLLGHRNELERGVHGNKALTRCYEQFGWDSFKHEIIKVCDKSELFEEENRLLKEHIGRDKCMNERHTLCNHHKCLQ